jgi:hypothetical protein
MKPLTEYNPAPLLLPTSVVEHLRGNSAGVNTDPSGSLRAAESFSFLVRLFQGRTAGAPVPNK